MKILILITVTMLVICSHEALNNHENVNEIIPFKHLKKVLLCLEPDDQLTKLASSVKDIDLRLKLIDEHPELNIEFNTVDICEIKIDSEIERKRILAVVAPKPLKTSSQIPMYFFDTPFLNEDDVHEFPNGLFPLRSHWQSLKHAFSHYLTTHGYQRMVVVSDDSYYSAAFEAELIEHFKYKEFVFDVQRKPNKGSFDRAMRYIIDNKAYIIIVNIDNVNAQKLADAAKKHGLLSSRYLWLVRDWPFENVKQLEFMLMISMTLSPYSISHKAKYAHDYDGPHGPNLNSVSRGLTLISDAAKSVTNVTVKERIDYYYNEIYKKMNTSDKTDLSKAYICKFISGRFVGIKSMIIHDSGRIDSPYKKDPELTGKDFSDFDLPEPCLQRSRAFSSPCNDTNIVIICVVWLMFIVMVILLIFFFNRCPVWT